MMITSNLLLPVSITRPANEILSLFQIQRQCHRKGNGGRLGWLIVGIVADFGEMLSGQVGFGVDFGVLFPGLINALQQCLGKTGVGFLQKIGKTGFWRSCHGHRFRRTHFDIFPLFPPVLPWCELLLLLFPYVVFANEAGNSPVALPGKLKRLPVEHYQGNHHLMFIQKTADNI